MLEDTQPIYLKGIQSLQQPFPWQPIKPRVAVLVFMQYKFNGSKQPHLIIPLG